MKQQFSRNQKELISIIRETDCPEKALMTAALIVIGYLKQNGLSQKQAPLLEKEREAV